MEKTPKKNAGKKASEPVTKCDQSNKVVAICDQLNNEVEIMPIEKIDIAKLIVVIRDQQVLIDRDLAMLYGVETKHLNERVKRNVARFPERFRFQLTRQEMKELVAKYDRLKKLRHSTSLSYAFTEQGISMLSAVLASQTAVDTSIRIMDAFVGMRRYLSTNAHIFQRLDHLEMQQLENKKWKEQTDEKIDLILDKMDANSPKLLTEIDNFVDDRVLSLLDKRGDGVEAMIHSRYSESFLTDLHKHNVQQREIKFTQLPHRNHDRFLIIDDEVYLLGASVKDMGVGLCAITKMQTTPETVLGLLE